MKIQVGLIERVWRAPDGSREYWNVTDEDGRIYRLDTAKWEGPEPSGINAGSDLDVETYEKPNKNRPGKMETFIRIAGSADSPPRGDPQGRSIVAQVSLKCANEYGIARGSEPEDVVKIARLYNDAIREMSQ